MRSSKSRLVDFARLRDKTTKQKRVNIRQRLYDIKTSRILENELLWRHKDMQFRETMEKKKIMRTSIKPQLLKLLLCVLLINLIIFIYTTAFGAAQIVGSYSQRGWVTLKNGSLEEEFYVVSSNSQEVVLLAKSPINSSMRQVKSEESWVKKNWTDAKSLANNYASTKYGLTGRLLTHAEARSFMNYSEVDIMRVTGSTDSSYRWWQNEIDPNVPGGTHAYVTAFQSDGINVDEADPTTSLKSVRPVVIFSLHTHSYTWTNDASYHWEVCSCGDIRNKSAHTASGWKTNSTQHWKVCTNANCNRIVSAKTNHTASTWKTNSTQHWKECTICGYITSSKTNHTASAWKTNSTQHWKECTSCGYITTAKADHIASAWKTNSTQHWKECTSCGYITTAKANHTESSWKINSTQHWKECTTCGFITSTKTNHVDSDKNGICDSCGYRMYSRE